MGFSVTDQVDRAPQPRTRLHRRHRRTASPRHAKPRRSPGMLACTAETGPRKNRVWDFSGHSPARARFPTPQPVALHQETFDTSTASVSGALCYGHRFYEPPLGRWTSRDPIGERGFSISRRDAKRFRTTSPESLNRISADLYNFVCNTPLDHIDAIGLTGTPYCRIAIGAYHGSFLPGHTWNDDSTWHDVDPNSDSGKFASDKNDAGYIGIGLVSCWLSGTMQAVDAMRTARGTNRGRS